jgi:uridine kinase
MTNIFASPLFLCGLAFRVILVLTLAPHVVGDWYVPFLETSVRTFTLDPWAAWLSSGGNQNAFPYGYVMWVVMLPGLLVTKLLALPITWGYHLTLLAADFLILLLLNKLIPSRQKFVIIVYWLSPIVILATYGLGLNDLVPVALLTLALWLTRRVKLRLAGVVCAAAISAKLSMVVALPFFAIYLFNNRSLRQRIFEFFGAFGASAFILMLPFMLSDSAVRMLFSNPEMAKIYRVALDLGGQISIYAVALFYMVMLYSAWRIRRINFDLFQSITGLVFLMVVLLTPASPGWFVWSIPFLVIYQAMSGRRSVVIIWMFSFLYLFSTLLGAPIYLKSGAIFQLESLLSITGSFGGQTISLLHTAMVAIGIILALRIWRESISGNDFFRLSRKTFVIGVAGDSGAGKDTFSDAIAGLFGEHSVVKLSGDDYHLWDRQKPMWQVMTHLNPMANDLEGFGQDLVRLTDGKNIMSRHYDHKTGKMSKLAGIRSNDFVIAAGLHALYLPILRDCYNLKIYLDIDEKLRRHFKIVRDVKQRGHALEKVITSLDRREPDAERFIRPQALNADLVLSLQPVNEKMIESHDGESPIRLKLVARTKHGFNEPTLLRVLVGVCGLHVDLETSSDGSEVVMAIEGESTAADISMAAELLCPKMFEFLDIEPQWQDGVIGLMQLITLSHINQSLTKRLI